MTRRITAKELCSREVTLQELIDAIKAGLTAYNELGQRVIEKGSLASPPAGCAFLGWTSHFTFGRKEFRPVGWADSHDLVRGFHFLRAEASRYLPEASPGPRAAEAPAAVPTVAQVEAPTVAQDVTPSSKSVAPKGRYRLLSDADCLRLYRNHYDGGQSIAYLAKSFAWGDTPGESTARSRVKKALEYGRDLTLPRDRPASDPLRGKLAV